MKTIILVGVPGCGKSSILKHVTDKIPEVQVINYGDAMLKRAERDGITRDVLRKLPLLEQQKMGVEAAKDIMRQKAELAIIDTHALIRTKAGFCPGLPKAVLDILCPKACAWVECSPKVIIERRQKDTSRSRDEESEEELQLHQELSRAYLAACSMETGAVLTRISNDSPSIEKNALPLILLIRQFLE